MEVFILVVRQISMNVHHHLVGIMEHVLIRSMVIDVIV